MICAKCHHIRHLGIWGEGHAVVGWLPCDCGQPFVNIPGDIAIRLYHILATCPAFDFTPAEYEIRLDQVGGLVVFRLFTLNHHHYLMATRSRGYFTDMNQARAIDTWLQYPAVR